MLNRTQLRAGFTLVESLMAVTFLAVLFLMVAHTSARASDAYEEGSVDHELTTEAHRGLERITAALELADSGVITQAAAFPTLGTDTLTFRHPVDFVGGVVQWSADSTTIAFEPDTGELLNDLDDDGDGYVDEGRVVLTEGLAGGQRVVLVPRVAGLLEGELDNGADDNGNGLSDERGLSFVAADGILTIRLTCQRRDESGRVLTKTVETAIRVRN